MSALKIGCVFLFCLSLSSPARAQGQAAEHSDSPVIGAPNEAGMDSVMAENTLVGFASRINIAPLEPLPILNNGRLKPLGSFARESILFVTGSAQKWSLDPLQLYLALSTSRASLDFELINVRSVELREKLGFAKSKRFFSLRELEATKVIEISQPLIQKQEQNAKSLSQEEKDIVEVFNQMWVTQQIITGDHLAHAVDITAQTSGAVGHQGNLTQPVQAVFEKIAKDPESGGEPAAAALVQLARAQQVPAQFERQMGNINLEVTYNHLRLFLLASILFLALGGAIQVARVRRFLGLKLLAVFFAIPFVCLVAGFAIRVTITGFAPVTSMYGTMIWVSLGVSFFSMVLFVLYRNAVLSGLLWIGAGLMLLLTESIPLVLNPDMDPIVAVLRSNYWLTIHVLTITISYAAFTVTMLIGNTALVRSFLVKDNSAFFKEYAKYAYRMIQLGVFLLTVGIILGGIWADYSWGRFWGWDPKETWALIADVGFIAILHARYAGWLDSFGLLAACPIAYLLVVMAWYGVNFILASGLHSYGFSSGGALAVAIFVSAQLVLLVSSAIIHVKKSKLAAH